LAQASLSSSSVRFPSGFGIGHVAAGCGEPDRPAIPNPGLKGTLAASASQGVAAIRSPIMRSRPSAALLAAGLALLGGGHACGQGAEAGGVQIRGVVSTQTVVGGTGNVASGVGARAITSVGSIESGTRIDGRLGVTVQTGYIATLASGAGQQAVTSVGTVHEGSSLAGQNDVVISTGQIINMSDHSGRPACVVVGSTGQVPGC
jgi:hypothetical protein